MTRRNAPERPRCRRGWGVGSLLLLPVVLPLSALQAQDGAFFTAGRVLAGNPSESSWRVTVQKDITGPLGVDGSFLILPGARPATGNLYGLGADLTLFSGARGVPTDFCRRLGRDRCRWTAAALGGRIVWRAHAVHRAGADPRDG